MTSEPSFATTTASSRPRAEDASVRPSPRWLRAGVTLAFTGATLGTAVETLLVAVGGFRSLAPPPGLVAVWLPALHRRAAAGVGAPGKRLVDG